MRCAVSFPQSNRSARTMRCMAGKGMKALHDTITYAKEKGLFVITDGKRNDIGSTMQAYAAAHLGKTDVGRGNGAGVRR
jgi:orotidine-5'-phosphate decarboxylase